MTIGKRLQEARKRTKLTQKNVGEEMSVSQKQISTWENSDNVEWSTIERYSRAVGSTPEAVVTGRSHMDLNEHQQSLIQAQAKQWFADTNLPLSGNVDREKFEKEVREAKIASAEGLIPDSFNEYPDSEEFSATVLFIHYSERWPVDYPGSYVDFLVALYREAERISIDRSSGWGKEGKSRYEMLVLNRILLTWHLAFNFGTPIRVLFDRIAARSENDDALTALAWAIEFCNADTRLLQHLANLSEQLRIGGESAIARAVEDATQTSFQRPPWGEDLIQILEELAAQAADHSSARQALQKLADSELLRNDRHANHLEGYVDLHIARFGILPTEAERDLGEESQGRAGG